MLLENEELKKGAILHWPSRQIVKLVTYDRLSGEVSFILDNSTTIYTCFDYELISKKGLDHLRKELNKLRDD